MTPKDHAIMDKAFPLLEQAAIAGERCPQSRPHGPLHTAATGLLARAGKIRVEIFSLNWRVVTILEGPHKGKHTARCPHGGSGKPYKVIERDDYRRSQPSAPRVLSREELR